MRERSFAGSGKGIGQRNLDCDPSSGGVSRGKELRVKGGRRKNSGRWSLFPGKSKQATVYLTPKGWKYLEGLQRILKEAHSRDITVSDAIEHALHAFFEDYY
jgi:hypothetical protein